MSQIIIAGPSDKSREAVSDDASGLSAGSVRTPPERAIRPRLAGWAHLLFVALLALATTFHLPLDGPALDSFHEGEYAIYGGLPFNVVREGLPIFIHGGINHIPSRLAASSCPEGRQIICIRAINGVFIAATALGYLTVLMLITGVGTWRAFAAGLPAMTTLIAYNGGASDFTALHQGAPSIRELFIMSMLICIAVLSRYPARLTVRSRFLLVGILGALAGFGLFWAYNRGLTAFILAGVGAVLFSVIWRDWRPIPLALVAGGAGLAVSIALNIYGDLRGNVLNVLYWLANSRLFWLPRNAEVWLTLLPAVLLSGGVFLAGSLHAWRGLHRGQASQAVFTVSLLGLIVLYAVQIHARPDIVHLRWTLWLVALLAADLISVPAERATSPRDRTVLGSVSVLLSLALASYNFSSLASAPVRWFHGVAGNMAALSAPAPSDIDLVSPGLRRAAEIVGAIGQRCTYSFSNDGLFYVIARIPPRSRFAYPVYVAPGYQSETISELDRLRPQIVLGRSQGQWNNIDGLGLEQRTPALAQWLTEHYPFHLMLSGGYELRAMQPISRDGR